MKMKTKKMCPARCGGKLKRTAVIAASAVLLCVFASCTYLINLAGSNVSINERKNEKAALVYGYINMAAADQKISWMSLLQIEPQTEKPYWYAGVKDGVFFTQGMVPGQYCINKFGSDGREFMMSYEVGCFEVEKSDLFYFGSYEMVWSDGKPKTLKRSFSPGEDYCIEKLLEITDKGTYWEGKLKKRLAIIRDARARRANIPRAPLP
jgi:hypothetical protein